MAPKKAAAAAQAASKKKASALHSLSAASEERLRSALKNLGTAAEPEAAASSAATAAALPREAVVARLHDAYAALLGHGFQRVQVERALSALPPAAATTDAALDWLLLHLDTGELPRRFVDGGRALGPVELKHRGLEVTAAERAQRAAQQAEERTAANAAAAPPAPAAPTAEQAARKAEEESRAAQERRAWVMQYMDNSESSEDESGASCASSPSSAVEDWEVWGDPREVERRRVERARAALPLPERKAMVWQELQATKTEAAAAKASRDKERQRGLGDIIRQLKQELEAMGLTEEQLREEMEPSPGAAAGSGSEDGDANWEAAAVSFSGEEGAQPGEAAAEAPAGAEQEREVSASGGSEPDSSDDDEGGLGFDLFDGSGVEGLESIAPARKARPALALQPWGATGVGKKGGKKGREAPKAPEVVQPKAALQQHCQRAGWPAPRFERLPPGGMRLEAGGYRYSVVIEVPAPARGPKKKAAQGPRTISLREGDDGWERVEDAQSAAATRALFELAREGDVQHRLPEAFQELWAQWEGEGEAAPAEASREEEAARQAFILSLVDGAAAAGGANRGGGAGAAGVEGSSAGARERWEAQLLRALEAAPAQSAAQQEDSRRMQAELRAFRESPEGAKWQADRGRLPVVEVRGQLLEALSRHDVVVVSGETGSGKTTQVPQFILEDAEERGQGGACSVVCTQPRRIAAISVAERVAAERGEAAPGEAGARVGYHVRLDAARTADTHLLFCTTGILLRRLAGDPSLRSVSHVVVDEVHERTLQGDFLMALLRDLVALRRRAGHPLRVVLMSATLDSDLFADYFGACPVLAAAGRTFPVQQLFLEDAYQATAYILDADSPAALRPDWDRRAQRRLALTAGAKNQAAVRGGWGDAEADVGPLNPHYDAERYQQYSPSVRRNMALLNEDRIDFELLEDLISHIDTSQPEGAILVLLPGMGEIARLRERLVGSSRFRPATHWVLPLHSTVSPAEQRQAFRRPGGGVRKIVLATNIAETSLTIEDVVYVVDSGKLKERRYDPTRGMSLLVEDWVSVASSKQRRGRAGRVRPGICYGLYSRHRYEERMRTYQAPEMVRVPLEELVLQIHLLRLGRAGEFLARVLQPPPERSVAGALRTLREVGALSEGEELTPLGHHLAALPVDARVGKLLLLAASLGCLAPALTIAACLSYKSPFGGGGEGQQDASDQARVALAAPGSGTIAAGQQSDHLLMVAAVDGWLAARQKGGHKAAREYAGKHLLSQATLEMLADMRGQFGAMLADIGFVAAPRGERRGRDWLDDRSAPWNRYAAQPAVVKAVLFAALYPNVAVMDGEAAPGQRPGWHDGGGTVAVHPSSINHPLDAAQYQRPYLTYLEKVKTSKTFIRDCTVTSPMAILLFGGALAVAHESGYVQVDDWIRIRAPAQTAVLVKQLRRALDGLLAEKVQRPGLAESGGELIQSIVDLLNSEEAAQKWRL